MGIHIRDHEAWLRDASVFSVTHLWVALSFYLDSSFVSEGAEANSWLTYCWTRTATRRHLWTLGSGLHPAGLLAPSIHLHPLCICLASQTRRRSQLLLGSGHSIPCCPPQPPVPSPEPASRHRKGACMTVNLPTVTRTSPPVSSVQSS